MEKIQVRALRLVYDDYSSSSETLLENGKGSHPTSETYQDNGTSDLQNSTQFGSCMFTKFTPIVKIQNNTLDTEIS